MKSSPARSSSWSRCVGAATSCLVVATAIAQDAPKEEGPDNAEPAPTATPAKSPLSVELNFVWTSAYYYHGILQEKDGFIVQPAATVTLNLFEEDDFQVQGFVGTWNSFQSEKTGANTDNDFLQWWFETDALAGFVVTKGNFSFTSTYTFFISPSDAFDTSQELDLQFAYDDSDLLGPFALNPYVMVGLATSGIGSDDLTSYLELGIAPGFSVDCGSTPIAITFPVTLGLSLHDYYENDAGQNDTFGFVQVGVNAEVPLPFGTCCGTWQLNAGLYGLFLGDNTAEFNGGSHDQVIGTVGLQCNF